MTTAPVLIVGAGPAGLVTAITLARQNVATLLVERRVTTSPFPRATGISTRTMELLRRTIAVRSAPHRARVVAWPATR